MSKKIWRFFSLLLGATFIAFLLVSLAPIDPVQQYVASHGAVSSEQRREIAAYFGMDQPLLSRYFHWFIAVCHGDFGESLIYRVPVIKVLIERAGNSFILMLSSWVFSGILGYILGIYMAFHQDRGIDRILKKICLFLSALPTYWIGLLLLLLFAVRLQWFPVGFSSPIGLQAHEVTLMQKINHLILPMSTLVMVSFSSLALYVRQKVIGILHSEYILFARAQGMNTWELLRYHVIKNSLSAALMIQFTSFAELFGGSVLTENVFSYPGLGTAITAAGIKGDVPLLLGITFFSIIFVFFGNLTADLLQIKLDQRLKNERNHRRGISSS